MSEKPRVGVGVIIVKGTKVLMGRRKGAHAAGKVSFPGGNLNFGETWEQCALRENEEECGEGFKIKIRPYNDTKKEFFVTNDIMLDYEKHYITIFMVADWIEGEPENCEPDKCEGWGWYSLDDILALPKDQYADWIPKDLIIEHRNKIGI